MWRLRGQRHPKGLDATAGKRKNVMSKVLHSRHEARHPRKRGGRPICLGTPWLALLLFTGVVWAAPPILTQNEPVLQEWRQQNPGGPVPELVREKEGGTRIEWSGNLTEDSYGNSLTSANGSMNSPLRTGTFSKTQFRGDLRAVAPGGEVKHFQLGLSASNDRSVLSLFPRQINNLQVGASGSDYFLALGDVSANFSSLSSMLGARGATGQFKFGALTATAFTGIVAESWEALNGDVVRRQFLRDVRGLKFEYQALPSLKVYLTSQTGKDQANSLPAGTSYSTPLTIRSSSLGFRFQEGALQVSGESARGGSQAEGQAGLSGHADLLDATLSLGSASLRTGYHNLSAAFASLSGAAQAGINESYLGADWPVLSWVSVGGEVRSTLMRALPTSYSPATSSRTRSHSLRAHINFGRHLPGWGVALQESESQTRDAMQVQSRNTQSSVALSYSSPKTSASLGHGLGRMRNEASPAYNSDMSSWQFNLARNFMGDGTWSLGANLNGSLQRQDMASGSNSRNVNYTLGLNGQRAAWGSFQLSLTDGLSTQSYGQPALKQRSVQLDASRPLFAGNSIKLYLRDSKRNIGNPMLDSRESVGGLQLASQF